MRLGRGSHCRVVWGTREENTRRGPVCRDSFMGPDIEGGPRAVEVGKPVASSGGHK